MSIFKSKLTKTLAVGLFVLLGSVSLPGVVFAQGAFDAARDDACQGVTLGTSSCNAAASSKGLNSVISTAINILSLIIGVIAVIMLIIGGLKYITSGGDSNSVNSAKNTILYAIIGLIIVLLAQVIVRFVLNRAT